MNRRLFLRNLGLLSVTPFIYKFLNLGKLILGKTTDNGNLYIALFTAPPTDLREGVECSYNDYARQGIAKNTDNWIVNDSNYSNKIAIEFPECTGDPEIINTVGIFIEEDMLFWEELPYDLVVSVGVTPVFAAGDLNINLD